MKTHSTTRLYRTFDPTSQSRNQSIGEHYARKQKSLAAKPAGERQKLGGLSPWAELFSYPHYTGSLGNNGQHLPHVPRPGGKMLLTLLALQLLSPVIAQSIEENEGTGKDTESEAMPSTELRPDALALGFKEDLRLLKRSASLEKTLSKKAEDTNTDIHSAEGGSSRYGRSARRNRGHHVVTSPQHVAATIAKWPTRRDLARQIIISNGLNPDEYRKTLTVNAPGHSSVVFSSYTNDTLLDQYYRSQLTLLGVAGSASHGLTHLPALDPEYRKAWDDFAATQLPEIRRKTARIIVDQLSSSFGVNPEKDTALVYELKSGPMLPDNMLEALARIAGDLYDMVYFGERTSRFLILANTGCFLHFPQKGRTVAVWESDGELHMESVPKPVFQELASKRAPSEWVDRHVSDFFSDDLRDRERFGEGFSVEPASSGLSLQRAAETATALILDRERLEKSGYQETRFERFVHGVRSILVPYYDPIRKLMDGDTTGALMAAADETAREIIFSVTFAVASKTLSRITNVIDVLDMDDMHRAVRQTMKELHIPKTKDFGRHVKRICKRGVGGCVPKPFEVRQQKHAAKAADRHKLPRPTTDDNFASWARGLTTKRVADLFGNGLKPDGSYRLTPQQAEAGFDNHLKQIQQEINAAVSVIIDMSKNNGKANLTMAKEDAMKFLAWISDSIVSAAKNARFDFSTKTIYFGHKDFRSCFGKDVAWLKFKKDNGHVIVVSTPGRLKGQLT